MSCAPVCLQLWLTVVHPILARQWLDEVLECHVAAHIVRHADCALHSKEASGKGWVEGLQVEAQLSKHGAQHRLCECMFITTAAISVGMYDSNVEENAATSACCMQQWHVHVVGSQ